MRRPRPMGTTEGVLVGLGVGAVELGVIAMITAVPIRFGGRLQLLVGVLLLFAGGFLLAYAAFRGRRWLMGTLASALTLASLVLPLVQPETTPRAWFEAHRGDFERARLIDPGDDYYGAPLPFGLSYLTSTGNVSGHDGVLFFPQWVGIPDDAGGFLYSPEESPGGYDLYGDPCTDPVSLGGGWWMCEM